MRCPSVQQGHLPASSRPNTLRQEANNATLSLVLRLNDFPSHSLRYNSKVVLKYCHFPEELLLQEDKYFCLHVGVLTLYVTVAKSLQLLLNVRFNAVGLNIM